MTEIRIVDAVAVNEMTTASDLLDDVISREPGWWLASKLPETDRCVGRKVDTATIELITLRAASQQPVASWLFNPDHWLPAVPESRVEFEQDAIHELNKYDGKHDLVLLDGDRPTSVVSIETSSADSSAEDLRWLTHMPDYPSGFLRREILEGDTPVLRTAISIEGDTRGEETAIPKEYAHGEVRLGLRAVGAMLIDTASGGQPTAKLFSKPQPIESLPELRALIVPNAGVASCTIEVALAHRSETSEDWRLVQASDSLEPDRRRNTLQLHFAVLSPSDMRKLAVDSTLGERARIVTNVRAPRPLVTLRFSEPVDDPNFSLTWTAETASRPRLPLSLSPAELSSVSSDDGDGDTYLDLMGQLAELGDAYELNAAEELANADELMRRFAILGTKLHRLVFGPVPRTTEATSDLGRFLAERDNETLAFEGTLRLPWRLFYDADYAVATDDAKRRRLDPDERLTEVDPNGFWGARFRIEEATPRLGIEQRDSVDWTLPSPVRGVAFIHPSIGSADHSAISTAHANLLARSDIDLTKGAALADWLTDSEDDQTSSTDLIYYFGHGSAARRNKANGSVVSYKPEEQAKLDLGREKLTIREMSKLRVSPLASNPLLFLNACETLHRDMAFTNPFIDFFYRDMLARAVIGCTSPVPAHFAVDFADRLLDAFCVGDVQLGDCLQSVTRELLTNDNNPFGLIYTIAGHSEVHTQRLD